MPISVYKGRDKQQQRALRLVEVGDEAFYDFILVAWRDDYLRAGMERGQIVSVHVGNQFANGFCGRDVRGR